MMEYILYGNAIAPVVIEGDKPKKKKVVVKVDSTNKKV
jgi:hypothetical protein